MASKLDLTDEQRSAIIRLMFERVSSSPRRSKIVHLATILGGEDQSSDEFYAAVYIYSLEENWVKLERDFAEFVGSGMFFEIDTEKPKTPSRGRTKRGTAAAPEEAAK
jgi:hypothetical protein